MSVSQPRKLSEQAAELVVALTADTPRERAAARSALDAWKAADPLHAQAAERMEYLLGQLEDVQRIGAGDSRPARAAIHAALKPEADGKRRGARIATAAMLALSLCGAAWLGLQHYPPALLTADLRAGTGQWQQHTLSDGSRLTLNSGSAVKLAYTPQQRTVRLVQGEVLVDVARDAARPFIVQTEEGSIRALGTRFVVRRVDGVTELSMLESKTAVQTAAQAAQLSRENMVVTAGQRLRIEAGALGPLGRIDAGSVSDAWRLHQLVVQDRPLSEVLDELARHRPGALRYDRAQLDGIRVSAVLPLDDTERALHLLLTSFPQLRIRTVTPYLVLIDAPTS
ncbi:FecR domain-containing protein [Massilia sp. BJB1822]|uniref:FecR family protein n=1 Tax=Massilia sp. BJB1822 TaxID=2744470 RepID=UPI0015936459|nr:FecR domain-containing protein [Massilia sp. BJB1822]NVD99115.1 FecR domain-containing protein [Massilia sp. BJB1822]